MSQTTFGSKYDFMSKSEKIAYNQRKYYHSLNVFLLFSVIHLFIMLIILLFPVCEAKIPWTLLTADALWGIVLAQRWRMVVKEYNKALNRLEWENLDTAFSIPPNSFLTIGCAIGLSMLMLIEMIPVSFNVIMNEPEISILAYGTAFISLICLSHNLMTMCSIKFPK